MLNIGLWKFTRIGQAVTKIYDAVMAERDAKIEDSDTPTKSIHFHPKIDDAEVLRLYKSGLTNAEIARRMDIKGNGSVGRVLRRNGIDNRVKDNKTVTIETKPQEPVTLTFTEYQAFSSKRFADGSKAAAYERLIWAIRKNGNPSKVKVIHTYHNAKALGDGFRGNLRACAIAIGDVKVSVATVKGEVDTFAVTVLDV